MQNSKFQDKIEDEKEMKIGKVAVLCGGPSNEREISLRSGDSVYKALLAAGLNAVLLDVKNDIHDIIGSVGMDVAFISLHGKFGEDGTIQKMLEDAGIPYTGSGVEASRLALDKIASKKVFSENSIPSPAYVVLKKDVFKNISGSGFKAVEKLGWPLVVKPQFEGSSIGLSIARDGSSLRNGLEDAFRYGDEVVIEEYIDGRELTVGILGGRALPVIEIVPGSGVYDYEAKYNAPDTRYLVPAPIDARASRVACELAERAHTALGCRSFSRVDMMMNKLGRIFVLEVNTIPGMTDRSLLPKAAGAAGISFSELCVKLVKDAVNEHRKNMEIR